MLWHSIRFGHKALEVCMRVKKDLQGNFLLLQMWFILTSRTVEKKHKGLCDGFETMVVEQWDKHVMASSASKCDL